MAPQNQQQQAAAAIRLPHFYAAGVSGSLVACSY